MKRAAAVPYSGEKTGMNTNSTKKSGLRNAGWLAVEGLRRTRASILVCALFTLLFGGFLALTLEVVYTNVARGEAPADFAASVFLIFLVPNLILNWSSRSYLNPGQDPFTKRLAFFRSLPIPVSELVRSRVVSMFFMLLILTPLFFLPAYLVPGSLRAAVAFPDYLIFVLFWLGYALLVAGIHIVEEMTFSGRTLFIGQLITIPVLFGILIAFYVLNESLAYSVMNLVQSYGFLPAAISLLIGAAALVVGVRVTERRLARRDLSV